jgi:hypothetical protein
VPPNVAECHCGLTRLVAQAQAARATQKAARSFSIPDFLGQLVILAAVFYLGLTWQRPEGTPRPVGRPLIPSPDPVPPSGSRPPIPPPATPAPAASVPPEAQPSIEEASEPPSPASSDSPTPSPSPTPGPKTERSEVDVKREQAQKPFEQALARLGAEASRLTVNARRFESICLGGRGEPASCEQGLGEISATLDSLSRGVQEAEEEARRDWVAPGVIRDRRSRHGLDESNLGDLAANVRRVEAQFHGKN